MFYETEHFWCDRSALYFSFDVVNFGSEVRGKKVFVRFYAVMNKIQKVKFVFIETLEGKGGEYTLFDDITV